MCATPRSIGVSQDGGYGTHLLVPDAKYLVAIPAHVDKAVAATYACSGVTVYSAINKVKHLLQNAAEPVVLMGAGGLGLNAVSLLKGLGHQATIVVDIDDGRLKAAVSAGAKTAVDGKGTTEEVVKRIVEACGGVAPVAMIGERKRASTGERPTKFLTTFDCYRPRQLFPNRLDRVHRAPQGRKTRSSRSLRRIVGDPVAVDAYSGADDSGWVARPVEIVRAAGLTTWGKRIVRWEPPGAQGACCARW